MAFVPLSVGKFLKGKDVYSQIVVHSGDSKCLLKMSECLQAPQVLSLLSDQSLWRGSDKLKHNRTQMINLVECIDPPRVS